MSTPRDRGIVSGALAAFVQSKQFKLMQGKNKEVDEVARQRAAVGLKLDEMKLAEAQAGLVDPNKLESTIWKKYLDLANDEAYMQVPQARVAVRWMEDPTNFGPVTEEQKAIYQNALSQFKQARDTYVNHGFPSFNAELKQIHGPSYKIVGGRFYEQQGVDAEQVARAEGRGDDEIAKIRWAKISAFDKIILDSASSPDGINQENAESSAMQLAGQFGMTPEEARARVKANWAKIPKSRAQLETERLTKEAVAKKQQAEKEAQAADQRAAQPATTPQPQAAAAAEAKAAAANPEYAARAEAERAKARAKEAADLKAQLENQDMERKAKEAQAQATENKKRSKIKGDFLAGEAQSYAERHYDTLSKAGTRWSSNYASEKKLARAYWDSRVTSPDFMKNARVKADQSEKEFEAWWASIQPYVEVLRQKKYDESQRR